jgi:tRNA dimethylallyltransferase
MSSRSPLIVITGPTAVGKTKLAVAVAAELNGEIINADSRQVYKEMNIGTGKDLEEYIINERPVPYHLINICEPGYQYNIKEYQEDFAATYNELQKNEIQAILCGGSGLYIESALEGNPYAFIPINDILRGELEDESKSRLMTRISQSIQDDLNITSLTTTKRLKRAVEISEYLSNYEPKENIHHKLDSVIFVLEMERAKVLERIMQRLEFRLANGMVEEIKQLLEKGLTPEQLLYYGLEYRWITLYVLGEMTYDEMFDRLNISIRQFAKRQMTWFRRMEKKGYELNWLDASLPLEELKKIILNELNNRQGT